MNFKTDLIIYPLSPVFYVKVFEENNGALELVNKPKFRPRTKHSDIKYHPFTDSIRSGEINVLQIDTMGQIADNFTNALDRQTFDYLR